MSNKRPSYSMIDVLEQALGLPTDGGYCIITKGFARELVAELDRLYELEDAVQEPEKSPPPPPPPPHTKRWITNDLEGI